MIIFSKLQKLIHSSECVTKFQVTDIQGTLTVLFVSDFDDLQCKMSLNEFCLFAYGYVFALSRNLTQNCDHIIIMQL